MVVLTFIQILVYIWAFITWPIYFLIYRPWTKTRRFHRKRAQRIEIQKDEVIYRALPQRTRIRELLANDNINTMDKLLRIGFLKFSKKNCLGTRRILEEKKITAPNGKVLNKYVMEPQYKWLDYDHVDQKSTYIGR